MPARLPLTTRTWPYVGVGLAYRLWSRRRKARSLHPRGRAFAATAAGSRSENGVPASLAPSSEAPAVIRISRALGLPELLPDVIGVAIRVLDARGPGRHQDVLLSSTGRKPVLRHVLWPRRSVHGAFCSSILGYRLGGKLELLAAEVHLEPDPGRRVPLSRLPSAPDAAARIVVDLLAARLFGRWHPIGRLVLGEELPADESHALRFNPFNTADDVEPVGPASRLRRPAYEGSQQGRHAGGLDEHKAHWRARWRARGAA